MVKPEVFSEQVEGLSTVEALHRLHNDIQLVLNQFIATQEARKSKSWINDAFHHQSFHTAITWISIFYILLVVIVQTIIYITNFQDSSVVFCQPIFIIIFATLSITIEIVDNKWRYNEIPNKVKKLLQMIQQEINRNSWTFENYPNPLIPFSPSVTLQWTYRDNKLVNLPWALLVRDDIILVRPGQISPGFCEAVEKSAEYQLLHAREVYGPTLQSANECFGSPKARKPLEYKKFKLLETPYLDNLKIFFEQALDRPTTLENHLRHFLMMKVTERAIVPVVVGLILLVNFVKYFYFDGLKYTNLWELFGGAPIAIVIPLLPLVFPIVWNCVNYFGLARYKLFTEQLLRQHQKSLSMDEDDISENPVFKFRRHHLWDGFVNIIKGEEVMLGRTTSLLHVLGSLTALCCIDKKGILSWPNPTAEKVFFLHNGTNASSESTKPKNAEEKNSNTENNDVPYSDIAIPEVLDITHHKNDPFQLHFDNTKWHRYLDSLKPLGLGILLNTCNIETQENYTKFCSHITCEAMYNEDLVPVTNRRCLCELAKEIGFVEQAQKVFLLEHQLCTFRHLQHEIVRRDSKFARSLQMSTKLKFPFPHMFAVVMKEMYGGTMQLLSQGTADIILDSCVDYWNGSDIRAFSNCDRRKIQDFYQRTSLTAYCTAFAYRPLYRGISDKLSKTYLELPRDCKQLYLNHRSPTPVLIDSENVCGPRNFEDGIATDSILQSGSNEASSDVDTSFEMQCNQIFIGMVTMQYQAQQDMVDLIEQLEKGCIRFVHFSKENELRSRVFNEKMGLESGWNCHISLLSERSSNVESTKALSYSAPGAINLEHSVVKFDMEREPLTMHVYDQESEDGEDQEPKDSADVINPQHEWQSLSCLTDSTESAPVNFDMSNRAMLPRGIENIKPHIENVDNVPLLVSLFTDCTPSNTKEMLKIMQEYGEVICVIGSSANCQNSGIFMQANASISVEPLYPQICCKTANCKPAVSGSISPTELSRALNSIPCSLSIKRENPLPIYYLIIEARAFTTLLKSMMQFWLCSCLTLSCVQLLTACLMLPPLLTMGQVLWICCLVVPLLSISLMGSPIDRESMKKPQGKRQIGFSYQKLMFVFRYYCLKFVPMVLIVVACYCGTLASYCTDTCIVRNCTCVFPFYPEPQVHSSVFNNWVTHAQGFSAILILLHLVTVSITFVHRRDSIWQRSPHTNYVWVGVVMILFVLQLIFSLTSFDLSGIAYENTNSMHIGKLIVAFAFVSPLITLFVCEIVKRQEIKENIRCERRRKLEFGTKLGMNSPF